MLMSKSKCFNYWKLVMDVYNQTGRCEEREKSKLEIPFKDKSPYVFPFRLAALALKVSAVEDLDTAEGSDTCRQ